MKYWGLLLLIAVLAGFTVQASACVHPSEIYYWADKRDAKHEVFSRALSCEEATPQSLENVIISLGRVGGEVAVVKISPLLSHSSAKVRQAAAFALGIAKVPAVGEQLIAALASERNPQVQYRLTLALGNSGYKDAQQVLVNIINQDDSLQKVRGALQGLVILSAFHKGMASDFNQLKVERVLSFLQQAETQLEASYLLARVPLLEQHQDGLNTLIKLLPDVSPAAQANLIRALGKAKQKQALPTILKYLSSEHIGTRVNAIRSLSHYADNPVAIAGILNALSFDDTISQVTALQTIQGEWFDSTELQQSVLNKLDSANSWIQSEALIALVKSETLKDNKKAQEIANKWLDSDDPNHHRAAIRYYVAVKNDAKLNQLAKSTKHIIANGAKQALEPTQEKPEPPSSTPKTVPDLPQLVVLKTTKGDITIKLFADTPYTSANFIRLIKEGFYNNTYFHRVIPNFVAQGGSKYGDGTGNVDYSIREELSYRSHLPGTVGMATLGKDTGGAQFFINTAPNLHLDSNYTIFGEVIEGMGVAIKLEQNDKVLSANLVEN